MERSKNIIRHTMKGKNTMNNEYYTYIGALRVFNDFSCQTNEYAFSYDYNASGYEKLLTKYRIDKVAGNGSELDKALNLMKWCSENVLHNGGTKDVEFNLKHQLIFSTTHFKKEESTVFTVDSKL